MDKGLKGGMEPDEVTIVVHGARGLHGKKQGRHKFSVIFGVGSKKFRTGVCKDANGAPDWNEESAINVGHPTDQVFFTVMEKDDVLGQVVIPALSLQTVKGQVKKVALKPHKKCMSPRGELIYQCYISKQRVASMTPLIKTSTPIRSSGGGGPQLTGFARLKNTLTPSPVNNSNNSNKREHRSSLANFNKKLSRSIHNIFSFVKSDDSHDDDDKPSPNSNSKFASKFRSTNNLDDLNHSQVPVITNVIPNIGTVKGGTRIIIEGRNLGLGKSDIIELMMCDIDLLDTVEFESSNCIVCTTKECDAGKGDIWYETVSGGQTVVKNFFTFVDSSNKMTIPVPVSLKLSDSSSDFNEDTVDSKNSSFPNDELDLSSSVPPTLSEKRESSSVPPSPRTPANNQKLEKINETSRWSLVKKYMLPDQKSKTLGRPSSNDNIEGRYKKNFMKHVRRASESIVAEQEGLKREDVDRHSITKKELQAEVIRLYNENQALKNENADMKGYIDRLIAKVIQHCPDALETV